MNAIELLEQAIADALACKAVAASVILVSEDGETFVLVSDQAPLNPVWAGAVQGLAQ